ncbi:hypothetical protein CH380_04755 [Leptospira adleri]|uniref:Uncharacterized protein n=1 Tax=Leptospira adleri TaxID=2023186 RepID=A0A2M9YS95_9LEPT|nr:hypothetical protein CH380_04755 [Leptospira adleri]PJZ62779.1 hypothetical protein CH376_06430 [Leptospira adleri]
MFQIESFVYSFGNPRPSVRFEKTNFRFQLRPVSNAKNFISIPQKIKKPGKISLTGFLLRKMKKKTVT